MVKCGYLKKINSFEFCYEKIVYIFGCNDNCNVMNSKIHFSMRNAYKGIAGAVLMLCALLAAGCGDDETEETSAVPEEGKGILVVDCRTEGAEAEDLTLYLFGTNNRMVLQLEREGEELLTSGEIPVASDAYMLVAVANTKGADLPQEATEAELAEWLKEHAAELPGLLTASEQVEVTEGEVTYLTLELAEGISGIRLSTVSLLLTVPEADLPAYAEARAGDSRSLRCVAEVCRAGTDDRILRLEKDCTPQADGTYLVALSLTPGSYDLRIWADRDGGYYNADDLGKVTVLTDSYTAGEETDQKDAYYAAAALDVTGDAQDKPVALIRPFAKYRLIATDVEGYLNLIANGKKLPDIENLQVRVTYEGFFPMAFNVGTGKPNDALNTGIHYTSMPAVAEGYDEAKNIQLGADFVLTADDESFTTVTLQMIDIATGEAVTTVEHVKIPYKRGCLTTVTGNFLTVGKTPGGVQVDTEWGENIVIGF